MPEASPPTQLYARRLERLARPAGILVSRRPLAEGASAEDLEQEVAALNADNAVDGILIEMPLPKQLRAAEVSALLDPRKDVDGVTVRNAGLLYFGLPAHLPSTASAIMQILASSGFDPAGRHAVVVGRSAVVGHPVAELLLHANATVTMTHSKTQDLGCETRRADLLVVAAGRPGLVTGDMIKPGAVVIDAGINVTDAGVVGDVDFGSASETAGAITPVPGGVGPVTNAVLLRHLVHSAEQRST
jgi:methylenetetrahydrofolate dehydrogenase (NADP+)/methenyltetrahydrofolate cyclohydrolase